MSHETDTPANLSKHGGRFAARGPAHVIAKSALPPIVLQKSSCGMGLKFSEAWARRLNNDVGDHVATRQTHRRFWQRVCGSTERRMPLGSFFGANVPAAAFRTFATLSANSAHRAVAIGL